MRSKKIYNHLRQKNILISIFIFFSFVASSKAEMTGFTDTSAIKLSGFGTLGITTSDDSKLGFRRDISRSGVFDGDVSLGIDSVIGLQIDANLSDNADITLQTIAREDDPDEFDANLEWAFLSYRLTPSLRMRAGRLGIDVFLLSDHRQVGYAYPWARPPVEYYGPIFFNHIDGFDLSLSKRFADTFITVNTFAGLTRLEPYGTEGVDVEPWIGGSLTLENGDWRFKGSLAEAHINSTLAVYQQLIDGLNTVALIGWSEASTLATKLELPGKKIHYKSIGISYDDGDWIAQSELAYIDSDFSGIAEYLNAYLSIGRQIDNVTLYTIAGFSEILSDRTIVTAPSPEAVPLAALTQQAFDMFSTEQQTLSFGVRWDLAVNMALKMQWDRSWVKAYNGGLWHQIQTNTDDRTIDTFSFNFNFIF